MSKSHRKSYRSTICMVSLKSMRQWKNDSTQIRRSRENTELKKIDPQDPEETQRNITPTTAIFRTTGSHVG